VAHLGWFDASALGSLASELDRFLFSASSGWVWGSAEGDMERHSGARCRGSTALGALSWGQRCSAAGAQVKGSMALGALSRWGCGGPAPLWALSRRGCSLAGDWAEKAKGTALLLAEGWVAEGGMGCPATALGWCRRGSCGFSAAVEGATL